MQDAYWIIVQLYNGTHSQAVLVVAQDLSDENGSSKEIGGVLEACKECTNCRGRLILCSKVSESLSFCFLSGYERLKA